MTGNQRRLIEDYAKTAPLAQWLGFSASQTPNGMVFSLTFGEQHIGNKVIRALHGGAIAAFLEFASEAALYAHLGGERSVTALNGDIDYLTSARAQDMKARVSFTRIGRRLAFVDAVGWQKDENAPVATGKFRFRLGESPT